MHLQPNDLAVEKLWALVPVKSLQRSKQRLKSCLGADRSGLAFAMLRDVLNALLQSRSVTDIAVVTADRRVANLAVDKSAMVVDEVEPMGMNEALELGIDEIMQSGGQAILIVPADIPLATGPEVDRLLHDLQIRRRTEGPNVVGIGPSRDRGGTNFMCFDTRCRLPLLYGPGSYRRHTECALEHGSTPVPLHAPGISLDIDEEKDLAEFITFCVSHREFRQTETWRFLQGLGYVDKVRQTGTVTANE